MYSWSQVVTKEDTFFHLQGPQIDSSGVIAYRSRSDVQCYILCTGLDIKFLSLTVIHQGLHS